jgi:hypothetical protein
MKTIALNTHSTIYRLRKPIIIFIISLCFTNVFAKQVKYNYGLDVKLNRANQIVQNPQNIAGESYQWKNLNGFGASSFLEMKTKKQWRFVGKLGYTQKGFTQQANTLFDVNSVNRREAPIAASESNKNKFHYLNFDALVKYNLTRKAIIPFLQCGLRANYLFAKNWGSAEYLKLTGNQFYNYSVYKNFALGLVAGIGLSFKDKIMLSFESDLDLSKSVNTSYLSVKNQVFSVLLSFNINQVFSIR